MNRSLRRRFAARNKPKKKIVLSWGSARARIASVRALAGRPAQNPKMLEKVKTALAGQLDRARDEGRPLKEHVAAARDGTHALEVATTELDRQDEAGIAGALGGAPACRMGCAFCCVLRTGPEDSGLLVTEAEARRAGAALAKLQGQPDGRSWIAQACPALDPESRACRIYETRPVMCRSVYNTDAQPCADLVRSGGARGYTLNSDAADIHYLAHAIGVTTVGEGATGTVYSFARFAGEVIDGAGIDQALSRARFPKGTIGKEVLVKAD